MAAKPPIEERLHLSPWTEEQIQAALAEGLPAGWSAVRDSEPGAGVYYWNEETDSTTWLKPIASAKQGVARARQKFERSKSRKSAIQYVADSGGDVTAVAHWPPLPSDTAPAAAEMALRGAVERIKAGKVAANLVLDRVGMLKHPPPRPLTTKERVLAFYREHDEDFDEDMWQWRPGGWTHLPPPGRGFAREEVPMNHVVKASFKINIKPGDKLDAGALLPRLQASFQEKMGATEAAISLASAGSAGSAVNGGASSGGATGGSGASAPSAAVVDGAGARGALDAIVAAGGGVVELLVRLIYPQPTYAKSAEAKLSSSTATDLSSWLQVEVQAPPERVQLLEEKEEPSDATDAAAAELQSAASDFLKKKRSAKTVVPEAAPRTPDRSPDRSLASSVTASRLARANNRSSPRVDSPSSASAAASPVDPRTNFDYRGRPPEGPRAGSIDEQWPPPRRHKLSNFGKISTKSYIG